MSGALPVPPPAAQRGSLGSISRSRTRSTLTLPHSRARVHAHSEPRPVLPLRVRCAGHAACSHGVRARPLGRPRLSPRMRLQGPNRRRPTRWHRPCQLPLRRGSKRREPFEQVCVGPSLEHPLRRTRTPEARLPSTAAACSQKRQRRRRRPRRRCPERWRWRRRVPARD